jgi:sensor histidine kinase YesM
MEQGVVCLSSSYIISPMMSNRISLLIYSLAIQHIPYIYALSFLMKRLYLSILVHIIGSSLFLMMPLLFSQEYHSLPVEWHTVLKIKSITTYILVLIFFYSHTYYLLPNFYYQQKNWMFASSVLFALAIIIFLPAAMLFVSQPFETNLPNGETPYFTLNTLIRLHIKESILLFFTAWFASLAMRINHRFKQLQQDKVNAELSYLKAQINPHFLFNTLNSIYSLAIVHSDKTAESIVKLSGMMRYVISETSKKFVPLEKEMNYIDSYINLQKIRLGETAIVNYAFSGQVSGKTIAPLVLIPFIENAFKHGVNPEETSQIDIQISVSDSKLYLHVFNLKVPHRYDAFTHSGHGLENGKNQLRYLYPNKHFLKIDNNNLSFTVTLNLQLI